MTFLVGQRGTGWTHIAQGQGSGGSAMCYRSGYLATPGTAATAYLHIFEEVTASTAKVCIYDAGGNLVGQSGAIDVTSPGLKSAALTSSVELTAQTYKLVVTLNSGYAYFAANSGSNNFQDDNWNSAAFSYASPPPALPTPTSEEINREFVVWLDGSAGGGAQELDVGRADETDTALGLSRRKARATQAATTTDSAFATARRKSRAAGLAVETEQALSLARLKIRACGTAVETGSALNLARRKIRGCGRADETDAAFARPQLGVIVRPVGLAVETDTAFALEPAPSPAVDRQSRGGDDRPAHPGWNRRRALLQRNRDREFTAQIRDLYRALAADPSTAERAETIVAAVVPPQTVRGESAAAREAALTARADALRRRADALEQNAVQAEIALRLLYAEFREEQERDDLAAVYALLPEFFAIDAEAIDTPRRAFVADFWRDDLDLPALSQLLGHVL